MLVVTSDVSTHYKWAEKLHGTCAMICVFSAHLIRSLRCYREDIPLASLLAYNAAVGNRKSGLDFTVYLLVCIYTWIVWA
jgi:hypothetical protein